MRKTGLKTFACSFSVSLFAIFAANGVYLHLRPSDNQDFEIPSKNIMLFLKDDALNPSSRAAPVRKIALSVLPELSKEPGSGASPGVVYEPADDDIIMADSFIPLETGSPFAEEISGTYDGPTEEPPRPAIIAEATVLTAPKAEAPAAIVSETSEHSPEIPIQKQSAVRLAAVTNTPQTTGKFPDKAENVLTPLQKSRPSGKSDINSREKTEKMQEILVAENKLPQPLFPLEISGDEKLNGQKIRIGEPDKLNQVALADKNIPIASMENIKATKEPMPAWEQMSDKKSDSPWVVAKSGGALKNEMVLQQEYYQKENAQIKAALEASRAGSGGETKIASETVKNLLIPIPEDILNEENLVPQLSYSSDEKEQEKERALEKKISAPQKETEAVSVAEKAEPAASQPASDLAADSMKKDESKDLLASLNTIFSSVTKVKETPSKHEKKGSLFGELKKKFSPSKKVTIMPTEMRLSFQPNRAEISGQTLRWIQAFAARAAEDNTLSLEIRIDGTSGMELQQKRLNLLHNILTNKGVEYSKINTVFTSREPNSFIIRTVNRIDNRRGANRNNNTQTAGHYLQW